MVVAWLKYSLPLNPKHSDTQKLCCNHPKIRTRWLFHRVLHPKAAYGIANSEDPDQTAPDLGLHCLPSPICPKTKDHYGIGQTLLFIVLIPFNILFFGVLIVF